MSLDDVVAVPALGFGHPTDFHFSSEGDLLTYLWSPREARRRSLFLMMDLNTGAAMELVRAGDDSSSEKQLTLEETLRQERQCQRSRGVTHHTWSRTGATLLYVMDGEPYVLRSPQGRPEKLTAPVNAPILDPAGEWVAYICDTELYVQPLGEEQRSARQLTFTARYRGRSNGLAEFVAQEEMARSHGYWWSLDSKFLAFVEVDESAIPLYRIIHQGSDETSPAAGEVHHYPFPGGPNGRYDSEPSREMEALPTGCHCRFQGKVT
ncbi:MAG: DPP IV N-terminal domain-containing protein [Chloroflexi bacterium]|nr:DPP IV N-terminal domain-containing protein [Chloroflexota bacterium]